MRLGILVLLAVTGFALHSEESLFDPKGQARAHAAIWTFWNKHKQLQCESQLHNNPEARPFESPLKAAEDLLYQLTGAEKSERSRTKIPAIVTWRNIDELPQELRQELAFRIENLENSFYDGRQYLFSFGHVVRGEQAIQRYIETLREESEKIYPELLKEHEQLVELDRTATWQRIKTNFFPMFVPSVMAAAAAHWLYPHPVSAVIGGAVGFLPNFKIPLSISPLILKNRWRAVRGIRVGSWQDKSYRTNAESSPVFNEDIEVPNFYVEQNSEITSRAFDALKRNSEEALDELKRSCRLHSADCPSQEEAAAMDLHGFTNAYGVPGMFAVVAFHYRDHINRGHVGESVPVKLMAARFTDSQTHEPVLIQWMSFSLMPPSGNARKPKEQTAPQKQERGEPGLVPVPVRNN